MSAKQVQIRRGSDTEVAAFTGAVGEIAYDTVNKRLVAQDGSTAGGIPAAKLSEVLLGSALDTDASLTANSDAKVASQKATKSYVGTAIAALSTVYQAISTILGAIAALGSNGLIARTGSGTVAARTITAGTGITVSNGDGVAGNPTLTADGTVLAKLAGNQTLTGGFAVTPYNAGTKSSGTFTPDPANGNRQYATNGGAHTLAAPASDCSLVILYTNNGSAGAITFSGFTVGSNTGDSLTTTNASKFLIVIERINSVATYAVKALQ